jgi:hypothetical protein
VERKRGVDKENMRERMKERKKKREREREGRVSAKREQEYPSISFLSFLFIRSLKCERENVKQRVCEKERAKE